MVDAERWGVIIDKAMEGAREADVPSAGVDESDMFRADRALKSGAARLIERRRLTRQLRIATDMLEVVQN